MEWTSNTAVCTQPSTAPVNRDLGNLLRQLPSEQQ